MDRLLKYVHGTAARMHSKQRCLYQVENQEMVASGDKLHSGT